jgi:TonB family protein
VELEVSLEHNGCYIHSVGKSKFSGGKKTYIQFLKKHLQYPKQATKMGLEGTVIASFIVEPDGKITNVKISESVRPLLDEEVLRVIDLMPNWIPWECSRSHYNISIVFELEEQKKIKKENTN